MERTPLPRQIPILPSGGFDKTVVFYDVLGFVEVNRFGAHYLILEHAAGLELHFFGAGKVRSRSNDHGAYVRFDSIGPVETLHAEWVAAAATPAFGAAAGKTGRIVELADTDYGLREFAMLDIDGNLLRIGGPSDEGT